MKINRSTRIKAIKRKIKRLTIDYAESLFGKPDVQRYPSEIWCEMEEWKEILGEYEKL